MQSFVIHKDRTPEQTIRTVRDILEDLGIFLQEIKWFRFGQSCFSVRLEDMSYNHIGATSVGTNGKGVSPLYALASAYGEFMERLQNDYLYGRQYGLMTVPEHFYPDEMKTSAEEFYDTQSALIMRRGRMARDSFLEITGDEITTVPYYSISTGRVMRLPDWYIRNACGSNGLCAGNTPTEAILQGLCEIFERYTIRCIYNDNLSGPVIPRSMIDRLSVASIIRDIEGKNHHVVLRDCSAGGKYPVVAATCYNEDHTAYGTSFAADPILDVAVQRCLTEHYQGIDDTIMDSILMPLNREPSVEQLYPLTDFEAIEFEHYKCWTGNKGRMPASFHESPTNAVDLAAFMDDSSDHRTMLQHYLKVLKDRGYDVFIRDVSFAGFPAYRVFIPGLSETTNTDDCHYRFLGKTKRLREILMTLQTASDDELTVCASLLEEMIKLPLIKYRLLGKHVSFLSSVACLNLKSSSHFNSLEPMYLLALLYIRLRRYDLAYDRMQAFVSFNGKTLSNIKYINACLTLLKIKSEHGQSADVFSTLRDHYGQDTAVEVIADLKDPKDTFKHLQLPQCGECGRCPVRSECCYPAWHTIHDNLQKTMLNHPIDQKKFSGIF